MIKKSIQARHITIDTMTLSTRNNTKSKAFILYWIVIMLSLSGCVTAAGSVLDLKMSFSWIAAIIICSVLSTVIYSLKKLLYACITAVISLVFAGTVVYMYFDDLLRSFYLINGAIIRAVNYNYNKSFQYYTPIATSEESSFSITLFMILAIFIMAMVIGFVAEKLRNPLILTIILSPFIAGSLVFVDKPLYLPFLLMLLSIIVLISIYFATRKEHEAVISRHNNAKNQPIRFVRKNFRGKSGQAEYVFNSVSFKNRNVLASGVTIIVIFFAVSYLLTIFVPQSTYNPNLGYIKLVNEISKAVQDGKLADIMTRPNLSGGGISMGEIGTSNGIAYRDELHLKVETTQQTPALLKAYTGSYYDKNAWHNYEDISKEDRDLLNSFEAFQLSPSQIGVPYQSYLFKNNKGTIKKSSFSIEIVRARSDLLYLPYNFYNAPFVATKQNTLADGKITVPTRDRLDPYRVYCYTYPQYQGEEKYTANNVLMFGNDLAEYTSGKLGNSEWMELSNRYSDYVHKKYTVLPDLSEQNEGYDDFDADAREYLETNNMLHQERISTSEDLQQLNILVDKIKMYMYARTSYSLTPGKVERGKDLVSEFLFETQEGYCAYYATTAALMLRMADIPARYVEGYSMTQRDIDRAISRGTSQIEIYDTNAHAWVEVYVENIGWVPFDVTPSVSGNQVMDRNNAPPIATPPLTTDETSSSNTTSAPNDTSSTLSSDQSKPSVSSDTTSDSTATSDLTSQISSDTPDETGEPNGFDWRPIILVFMIIGIIALLWLAIWLRRRIILANRRWVFNKDDANKQVVAVFSYIEALLRLRSFKADDYINLNTFALAVEKNISSAKQGRFTEVVNIVQKARFSEHKITDEEIEKVKRFSNRLCMRIYWDASTFDKFLMAWVFCYL